MNDHALASATPLQRLLEARTTWQQDGVRIVWTNGCFDLLHPGHLRFLTQARALGDLLVVGINDDDSVRRLKGVSRPFIPLSGRITMLTGLRVVDYVLVLSGDTPIREVETLRPDIACKDDDYAVLPLPERAVVENYGGRMVLLPRDTSWSTTALASHVTAQIAPQIAARTGAGR
jgi:rfaE bifunctional protein nucleotidyltransferase chain/domain